MGYRYFTWQEVKGIGQAGWAKHDKSNAKIGNGFLCRTTRELKYDHSWDWLMPVVEKIEETAPTNVKEINSKGLMIFEIGLFAGIETVYQSVLEYIKWYNENKQK